MAFVAVAVVKAAERRGEILRDRHAVGITRDSAVLDTGSGSPVRIVCIAEQPEAELYDFPGRRDLQRTDDLVMLLAQTERGALRKCAQPELFRGSRLIPVHPGRGHRA